MTLTLWERVVVLQSTTANFVCKQPPSQQYQSSNSSQLLSTQIWLLNVPHWGGLRRASTVRRNIREVHISNHISDLWSRKNRKWIHKLQKRRFCFWSVHISKPKINIVRLCHFSDNIRTYFVNVLVLPTYPTLLCRKAYAYCMPFCYGTMYCSVSYSSLECRL